MKKLFFIGLLAATSLWQTGLCCSEIPADNTNGSTGTQTLCKSIAQENAPVYELIPGETYDDFCAVYAWNPTPYNVGLTLIWRYYDESNWHESYFEMSAYRSRYRVFSFSRYIVIDERNSIYEIIDEGPALDW